MRIAMISWRLPDDPRAGGAETMTFELLRRAVARGHEVTWFAACSPGTPREETVAGIRFLRRGRAWTVQFHAWRWLRTRTDSFDVVVDQINTLPFLTSWYVPVRKRRLFIHQTAREYWWRETRGIFRLLAPLGYLAEPHYLKTYRRTRTITVSRSTELELTALGFTPEQITVIPEAITLPVVDALTAKGPPLRLIVVGRLTPAKYVEEAVEAFARIHRRVGSSVLDIVGGGDERYRARLEGLVARHGVSDAVTFHGRVSDERKRDLLEAAHVHLFSSHREGWGLTVTEAGARGTPTVGYDAPGVRDSIADPRLLVPLAAGADGLAERVLVLDGDPALYDEVRGEAWRRARSLSFETATDEFLAALAAE